MDLAPPPADAAPAPSPAAPDADESGPPDRLVGGVAASLAARLAVDPLWLRITFVLLALVSGVGIVLYGALWLVFVIGAAPDRRWARLAGGAVLVGGLPLVLAQGFDVVSGPVAVLALLVGLALALWQPRQELRPAAAAPRPAADLAPAADDRSDAASGVARRRRMPRRTPRPPSVLGRLVLGLALLVAAVGAAVDQLNGARLHPEQWLGAAAVVCGGGLLIGAFAGRARWLVVPAALFAGTGFVAGEAARVGVELGSLVGDSYVWVGEGSAGPTREHVVLGSVDVSIDAAPTTPVTVDARAAVGEVRVSAADDVTVEVRADVGRGRIEVTGVRRGDGTYRIGPDGTPDVVVVARVGQGQIRIEQWPRAANVPTPPAVPTLDPGAEQYVADGVLLTAGGQLVLGNGEAVIDRDDTVLTGATVARDRVTVVSTSVGDFQLLPGGLLLTPDGTLLDLHAIRDQLAPPVDAGSATTPVTTPGG